MDLADEGQKEKVALFLFDQFNKRTAKLEKQEHEWVWSVESATDQVKEPLLWYYNWRVDLSIADYSKD